MNAVFENRLVARLPWLVIGLLAVVLLLVVVRAFWLFLDGPGVPAAEMPPVPEARSQAGAADVAIWDLFGEASGPAPVAPAREARPTELSLRLKGVIAGIEGAGVAVIEDDGSEGVFGRGDEIRSGVEVVSVEARRVIISRDGSEESLELPDDRLASSGPVSREQADSGPAPDPVPMPGFSRDSGFTAAGIASMGDAARSSGLDAAALAQSISVQPVSDGGFRVRPGRDARIFGQLGLQAGDVVVAVNGQELQTEADAMALFEEVSESGEVSITVRRDGQEQTLTPDLSRLGNR